MAFVAIALIGVTALAGTTLARNGKGHSRGHGHARSHSTLFAVLTGRNVINPTTGQQGAGDPDGLGSANVLIADADTVCFGISVEGVGTPAGAHIHRGRPNENGPHAVDLTPPSSGDPGASSGCVDGVASAVVTELRQHPNRFYIQIHTSDLPNGALRGQL